MLKKIIFCTLLFSITSHITAITLIAQISSASKRGAIVAALISMPCILMNNLSLIEKVATPVAAGCIAGLGSGGIALGREKLVNVLSKICQPFPSMESSLNPFLKNECGKLQSKAFSEDLGVGFGIATGLFMCGLCY